MTSAGSPLRTRKDLERALARLAGLDGRLARVIERLQAAGVEIPLRKTPEGFSALLRLIVAQQVSLESAAAIWARTQEAGLTEPGGLLDGGPEALARAGFSRPKIKYAVALAERVQAGQLDFAALRAQADAGVIETLTQIPGIGRWTAELYLLQALGRPDIWPTGDIALRTAAGRVLSLAERPSADEMERLGEPWRPLRAVAARVLWTVYKQPELLRP